ncbi:MAG: multiubiquitin domain-containing protein [Actinomycetota bacterium]|nr:multiubiquitin domain-containing protein [Actinomycetota bacterium]
MTASNDHGQTERIISFTIDGRPFRITDPKQTVGGLLHLAGLDPNGYDLGELRGNNPKPKVYDDSDTLQVQNGDRFVSIRQCAAVA